MSSARSDEPMDLTAAEYVLGTLDADERVSFAELLQTSEAARLAVAGWETRFAPLAGHAAPVRPSAGVWTKIEQAIDPRGSKTLPFRVIQGGATASVPRDLRVSRNRWRVAAIASGCAALVLLGLVFQRHSQPVATTYVAAVNRGGDKPALLVTVDLATRRVLVRTVAAAPPPPDHSYQLWYIGADTVPQSMGVLKGQSAALTLPARSVADPRATFAVSVEAPGGSKTGAPTSAPIYSGQLVQE